MNNILVERELGKLPVSIATALAIDGLFNRHPDIKPLKILPASKANILYMNARTMFRNIHGAVGDKDKANSVSPRDYAEMLLSEIDEIRSALAQESHPLNLVVYLPTYASIARYMGNGELKPLNTQNQKVYSKLENDCLQEIEKRYRNEENKPYLHVNMEIKVESYQNIFIFTHLPVDLLNVVNAADVFLVESHTGRVKPKDLWYTKFDKERSPTIPFNKATLLMFGDSGGLFKAQPIKARTRVIEVSNERKWNAFTTPSRMMVGLELSKEPILLSTFKSLLKTH